MNFYISDLHLFHKNVTKAGKDFDDRPFDNLEDMHSIIKEKWNNPNTKLTIEEFDRDNEIFVEVEPKLLWAELDKKSVYGKGPFFLLVTADEWNYDDDRFREVDRRELD